MLLVRHNNPLSPFAAFDREFGRLASALLSRNESVGLPAVNLWESSDKYIAEFDVPGFKMEQINVTVADAALQVSGETTQENNDERKALLTERRVENFSRSFSLPEDVDVENISAKLEDGVLRIELAKRAEVQPRRIEVKGL
jgi:HSP20 family protein